jgi:hypothetical protein
VTLVGPEEAGAVDGDEVGIPTLTLPPLSFREAGAWLPGTSARDRLRAYSIFGGVPAVTGLVDPGAGLSSNVRRLVLDPAAPLQDAPLHLLERLFQTPTRYAAILSALAAGEGDWSVVRGGVPDLSTSGQAGPYLKRLQELGMVEARRSLDAPPLSRNRRYRILDPFTAFWFRFILPHRHRLAEGRGEEVWSQVIRPHLAAHVASIHPSVCRNFMTLDGAAHFGARARECGSLWGAGYDIPVAGVLGNGSPFYGIPSGGDGGEDAPFLPSLDAQIRETRYGFGRERRLRIIFTLGEVPASLQREAARRHDAVILGPDALLT